MCWHKWCKWSEPFDVTVAEKVLGAWDFRSGKPVYDEYTETRQKRNCEKCGKYQERTV